VSDLARDKSRSIEAAKFGAHDDLELAPFPGVFVTLVPTDRARAGNAESLTTVTSRSENVNKIFQHFPAVHTCRHFVADKCRRAGACYRTMGVAGCSDWLIVKE